MTNPHLSVILLCHNEEETIKQEVTNYYKEIIKKVRGSEFIIAEDGSTDNTRKILYEIAKKIPLILNVTPQKRGYAKSLKLALEKSKGNIVFYADAGGKHEPKDFWKLYGKIKDYDFVTGYKKNRKDPWYRLFLAWGLNKIVNIYFGVSFKDIDSGFKLLTKKAVRELLKKDWIMKNNISLELVIKTIYSGFNGTEVPITHYGRKFGGSRGIPVKKIPGNILNLLTNFSTIKNAAVKKV